MLVMAHKLVRNQLLHTDSIPPKGREVITSSDIEFAFGVSAWEGPALSGGDSFIRADD